VASQNDALADKTQCESLLDRQLPLDNSSLAGFVALTGEIDNIPDASQLPAGAPFRINRDIDAASGYRTRTLLAIPLTRPDGDCVGVLELINKLDEDGQVCAFGSTKCGGVTSLAAMAAVTIHNLLLQDQLRRAQLDCIIRLSVAAEFRDDDTAEHIRRISGVSAVIARAMGLTADRVSIIEAASPMHDIGKIGIPDAILLKPGPLTSQERTVMQTHTTIGADILNDGDNELLHTAREVAMSHHERWDGRGYPNRLAGEQIPLAGRIVGLADVFDALVSRRCYKDAYPLQTALDIVRKDSGVHFDPTVTDAFFDAINEVLDCYSTLKE
jgi:HD-GYP domain-containing protein (c-di-GMP phosphodiesterase class II)